MKLPSRLRLGWKERRQILRLFFFHICHWKFLPMMIQLQLPKLPHLQWSLLWDVAYKTTSSETYSTGSSNPFSIDNRRELYLGVNLILEFWFEKANVRDASDYLKAVRFAISFSLTKFETGEVGREKQQWCLTLTTSLQSQRISDNVHGNVTSPH